MILSNSMHSIGSMLLLSGILIFFVSLKQKSFFDGSYRREDSTDSADSEILPADLVVDSHWDIIGRRLIIVGIVMNFIGGVMRLYEPGHPSLLNFFDNRWTSVMLVKHLMVALLIYSSYYALGESRELDLRIRALRFSVVLIISIGLLGVVAAVVGPGD